MGGSGGGGSSGKVDYPQYMEDWHEAMLGSAPATVSPDTIEMSITEAMNAALGASPYAGAAAYDPSADITAYEAVLTNFAALLTGLDDAADWIAFFNQTVATMGTPATIAPVTGIPAIAPITAIPDAFIAADAAAFASSFDDEIITKVLPRFQSGMRDINAVQSSAFVLGQAIIESFRDREVAKHESGLRLALAEKNAQIALENNRFYLDRSRLLIENKTINFQNRQVMLEYIKSYIQGTSQMLESMSKRVSWWDNYDRLFVESKRIKIVAKKEQLEADLEIDKEDAIWDLEMFKYGGNMLASIAGTAVSKPDKTSRIGSVLGGALSGAAAGLMVSGGNPAGAAIGGLLGLASGFL